MPIHSLNSLVICNTDVIRRNAYKLSILFMCVVHGQKSSAATGLPEQPEVCVCGRKGSGDGEPVRFGEVGQDIVSHEKEGDCVRGEQIRDEGV